MPRKSRLHYTDEMKSYIWDRYKTGDSIWSIAIVKGSDSLIRCQWLRGVAFQGI